MKKLTKTLSLVLVVAMVLGLCVIGAGASYSSFTDKDKITKDYSEAVEIMTDLGCVSGMSATTFAPAGNFTRAQAAVILTRLTLGATADSYVPSKVTFKDVPTSFWGYRYIEYAVQSGYVAGTGNGNYSPNATLTGYQWAAMLLKVLNITVPTTGTDWQINTAKAYYGSDKFSDVAISAAAITREAATQMAYDALFAGTSKTTGYAVFFKEYVPAVVSPAADAYYKTPVQQSTLYASMTEAATAASTMNAANGYTIYSDKTDAADTSYYYASTAPTTVAKNTLAKTVFGVTKDPTGFDAFGRPATVYTCKTAAQNTAYGWTNKTKTVANVAVVTYTAATKNATVIADLSGYTIGGQKVTTSNISSVNTTANGKVVAFYADGTELTKVEISYTVGKVANIVTATDGTVTYTLAAADKSHTTTCKDYPATSVSDDSVVLAGTVAKGDVVTYVTKGDVTYVYPTTTVTGAQTSKSTADNTITVASKTYGVAAGVSDGTAAISLSAFSNSTVATNVYYLDQYGFAVATSAAASFGNYTYIAKALGKVDLTLTGNTPTLSVLAVLQDGTVGQYTVNLYKDTASGKYYLNSTKTTEVYNGTDTKFDDSKATAITTTALYGYAVSGTTISLQELTAAKTDTANVATAGVYSTVTGADAADAITTGETTVATTAFKTTGVTYTALMNSSTIYVNYNTTKGTATAYVGNSAIPSGVTIPKSSVAVVSSDGTTVTAKVVFALNGTDTSTVVKNFVFIDTTSYSEGSNTDGTVTYTYSGVAADGSTVAVVATGASNKLTNSGVYTYNADKSITNDNAAYTSANTTDWTAGTGYATYFNYGKATVSNSLIGVGSAYYNITDSTKTIYIGKGLTTVDGNNVVVALAPNSANTAASTNVAIIYVISANA